MTATMTISVPVDPVAVEIPNVCMECGKTWESHYAPHLLCFKLGPFGTFGLKADHTPHIVGIHAIKETT